MKNDPRTFVTFALGILSGLCITGVGALARTVVRHEIAIAVLNQKVFPNGRPVVSADHPNASIWGAFGFTGPIDLPLRKERHETKLR